MSWVETASSSFVARHDAPDEPGAKRVLDQLEATRAALGDLLGHTVDDLTIVLHASEGWLVAASPFLPVARLLTVPQARRQMVGWVGRHELHVLAPRALAERARGSEDDLRMLERVPSALYARRVLADAGRGLPPPNTPPRVVRYVRWAWLAEGAAQYLAGQTALAGHAIARRLRTGPPPELPPRLRDAPVLGGAVFDLLARREGVDACVELATHLHPRGPRAALRNAFGLAWPDLQRLWDDYLERLTDGRRSPAAPRAPAAPPRRRG